jgi:hypothetical protein
LAETPTEIWVRQEVMTGRAADLRKLPDPVLSSRFLFKLLGETKAFDPQTGIYISGERVRERPDLSNLDAATDVKLDNFAFDDGVSLVCAHFHKSLSLNSDSFCAEFDSTSEGGTERTDSAKPEPGYHPVWYGLGLFLADVDIGQIKSWWPHPRLRFAPHYAHLHFLLGWIILETAFDG